MHTDTAFADADLNGFVDGRIDPARGTALAESLVSDPAARARIDGWRRQNESLRTMFAAVLAEPVPVRLLPVAVPQRDARVAGGSAGEAPKLPRRASGAVASLSAGMALVGFALGALASVGTDGFGLAPTSARGMAGLAPPAASGPQDFAARAAEAHRTFLADTAHPVELAGGEEPKLLRRAWRRLGGAPRIPSFARQGWSFLGGRIVPGRRGPAAFLAYGSGADRLGLLVSRGAGQGDGRVTASADEALPLGVATWDDGEFGFAITSDRGAEWLSRNVGPLRDSVKAQARAADEDAPQP